MKKITSVLLAMLFIFTAGFGVSNATFDEPASAVVKTAIDIELGESENALFVLDLEGTNAERVELRDNTGKTAARMYDTGTKGDGVYTAKLKLSSDTRRLVTYTAYADGKPVREYTVNYYRDFTEQDNKIAQSIYDRINEIESTLEERGADDAFIFDAVTDYLRSCDDIERMEIENGSCAYTTTAGISSLYARLGDDVKGTGEAENSPMIFTADGYTVTDDIKGNETLQSWTNPNVLLVRPFRNVAGEEGFHNDRYIDAAKMITKYTGGYITVLDNEETIPFNLLETFWQNGFVMVDSHGLTGYGKSYMNVWEGGGYTAADVTAGRVMKTNDPTHVYISGDYFQYYYEQMNRKMENTFLYFGICYGMTYDTMRTPFFEMGAVCAYGYDNSVSMGYEGYNLLVMYPHLTTICAEDETRTYNLEEAGALAIEENGDEDPWGSEGAKAHLVMYGATDFVVYKPDVPVTDAEMVSDKLDGIVGSNCYIPVSLSPYTMVYGYTQEWESSDPEVAEVVGPRMVLCKKAGTATVSFTITYGDGVFQDSCTVTVSEILPESITAECSGASSQFKVGQTREISAEIMPLDCGDKSVGFISNNPGTVSVDAKGILTSHRPGNAVVTVYAKANPDVYVNLDVKVSTNTVYKADCEYDYEHEFMLITYDSNCEAIGATVSNSNPDYIQSRAMSKLLGYYSGNISAACMWQFREAEGGFYLYNAGSNRYLSMSDKDGVLSLTEDAQSIFAMEKGRLYVTNPTMETENVYIKFKNNKGFYLFTSGTRFDVSRAIDFESDEFVTVSFEDEGKIIATQILEKGENAVRASVSKKDGKTFMGWDGCLYGITDDFTVSALYENGESDKITVTFRDSQNGIEIARIEMDSPGACTPPEKPVHEGMHFVCWSEDITNVQENMIVYAIYKDGVLGDINLDDTVNTADAVYILRYAAGMVTPDESQTSIGDVTGDGILNTGDAVYILKYASGLIDQF